MPVWICVTCGNHYPDQESPPRGCVICSDERQWVPSSGQKWTTAAQLASAGHHSDIREVEPGLLGIGADPPVAIGQRALVIQTSGGNLLWDPPGFLDEQALATVRDSGGLHAVTASHPHFYGSIVDWAHAFGAEILLPEADAHWLTRPDPAVRTWSGSLEILRGVTLVQCGGHFPGSAVAHWADGADGAGVLLTGDTIVVAPGEDRVTFVWSAPNRLPLPERAVRGVVEAVRPYRFDRIYGGWWQPVVRSAAREILETSASRYIEFLRGDVAVELPAHGGPGRRGWCHAQRHGYLRKKSSPVTKSSGVVCGQGDGSAVRGRGCRAGALRYRHGIRARARVQAPAAGGKTAGQVSRTGGPGDGFERWRSLTRLLT